MGIFRYVTNRTLPNKAGEDNKGKIKCMVKTGSDTLEGEYTCPECIHEGKVKQPFKRPINIKCGGCGKTLRIPKLKGKK